MGKIKTYSLVSNSFQIHFIKGEWETDDRLFAAADLAGIEKGLDKIGKSLEKRFERFLESKLIVYNDSAD